MTIEFDFLFCRLWQFLIGTLVFLLNENDEIILESSSSSDKKYRTLFYGVVLLLIFLCTMPELSTAMNYKFSIRLFATLLGGIVIYIGHYTQPPLPTYLDVFLTYLGNISYSFYLVHWPIILFGRYTSTDVSTFGFISIAVICVVVGILLYEFLDKLIPTKATFTVFIQTGAVFGIILMLCFNSLSLAPNSTKEAINITHNSRKSLSIDEVIKLNNEMEKTCKTLPFKCLNDSVSYRTIGNFKHWAEDSYSCAIDIHKNGTKTVALLGNSYAMRFATAALDGLRDFLSVKNMYLISRSWCPMFDTLNKIPNSYAYCDEMIGKNIAFVKEVKPDIIIHVAR